MRALTCHVAPPIRVRSEQNISLLAPDRLQKPLRSRDSPHSMHLDGIEVQRHPELYFADGDIVLATRLFADNIASDGTASTKYQLYRVHRPILRHHSQVFANMFVDGTPGQMYDGVPFVEMVGDDAEGFAALLTCIYNPSYVLSQLRYAYRDLTNLS